MRLMLVALAVAGSVAPAAAQEPTIEIDPSLPFATRRVLDIALDEEGAVVRTGETLVQPGDTIRGPLVQVGGRLTLEGRVEGDVTAVDAVVLVRPGAVVAGRMTILAGAHYGSTMATIEGPVLWLRDEPLEVVQTPAALHLRYVPPPEPPFPVRLKGIFGLVLREYNGVDGLAFGVEVGLRPRRAWPRTELAGGPVFRSERLEDVGWEIRGLRELSLLGGVELGGRLYSISDTSQRWHRADLANSVAAFLLANDDRAYHEREGYELWLERALVLPPVTLRAAWRDDDFDALESERPFALFAGDEDWPENPTATPGEGRALGFGMTWDRRNDKAFTTGGAYVEGFYHHWGFGGDFDFDWGQVDARAWLPVGERSFASLRVVAGGRLGGSDTLAPQFLYRLGGVGTVVGYDGLAGELTGDRAALANLRLHWAIAEPDRFFRTLWLVGLTDVGDAWFPEESIHWNVGLGAGLAGRGRTTYLGVFGAYGLESEEWKAYLLVRPWF
ncbi:MAG TPA: BamA/TamA family outer membrane protein [Gemmatimonadota bacterium]|nr:BamA/TamA family outer membrane protein [Gemmatimonadota bacterium]